MLNADFQKAKNLQAAINAREIIMDMKPNDDYGVNWNDWLATKNLLDEMVSKLYEVIAIDDDE